MNLREMLESLFSRFGRMGFLPRIKSGAKDKSRSE